MIESDGIEPANKQASAPTDNRVVQFWDGKKSVGTAYRQIFGLTKAAWDMFLVYGPDVDWTEAKPPTPTFYMHQMNTKHGSDPAKILKPELFYENVRKILGDKTSHRI